jgi:hypothetical protein
MVSPEEAPAVLMAVLFAALMIAVSVVAASLVWIGARWVSTRLERRYLPGVSRWSRRRGGLAEEAGPWACPRCSSVNAATVVRCYRCGAGRAGEAVELAEATVDPAVYHRPPPVNRFDPGLYRGPGAPPAPTPSAAVDPPPPPTPGAPPP